MGHCAIDVFGDDRGVEGHRGFGETVVLRCLYKIKENISLHKKIRG